MRSTRSVGKGASAANRLAEQRSRISRWHFMGSPFADHLGVSGGFLLPCLDTPTRRASDGIEAMRPSCAVFPRLRVGLVFHNRTTGQDAMQDGFLGYKSSFMLDFVVVALVLIVPILLFSLY